MEVMEDQVAITGDWEQPQEGYNPNDPHHRAAFLGASDTRVQDAYQTELDRLVLSSTRRADAAATFRVLDANRDGDSLSPSLLLSLACFLPRALLCLLGSPLAALLCLLLGSWCMIGFRRCAQPR